MNTYKVFYSGYLPELEYIKAGDEISAAFTFFKGNPQDKPVFVRRGLLHEVRFEIEELKRKFPEAGDLLGNQKTNSGSGGDSAKRNDLRFKCVICGISIRLRNPLVDGGFRCGKCKHYYRINRLDSIEPVYLVVANPIREQRDADIRAYKDFPEGVKRAFSVLEINPTEDLEIVRKAYRSMISQYHPDKVAHLGKDIQHIAAEKSRRIVEAFRIIEVHLPG